ncbi:hypothetical protein JY80_03460 [Neisseria meningitidis]|nr:hypothetical protein [Neisseria meningitidis]RNK08710.1 hypothetical protein COI25_11320 [Neisseria meningitidis]RNK25227.1 hypothetical protein COH93_10565 [Neisseria meningitidis]RPD11050.1 hypothetical protein JY80_03460 [Neisseria meningitidis]RPD12915.1 hypothetical protein JY82_03755 [Neisseria meningitidis]
MAKTKNKPLCHHSHFLCFIILAFTPSFSQKQKNQKQKPIIPAQARIQFIRFQPFPINRLSIWVLDSHFRGNDAERFLFFLSFR